MAPVDTLWIDRERGEVRLASRRIDLTAKEFLALSVLEQRRGELISRDEFARAVWPENAGITSEESIEKLVSRLRQKLEMDPGHPRYVITVRGRGYRLALTSAGARPGLSVPRWAFMRRRPVLAGVAALLVSSPLLVGSIVTSWSAHPIRDDVAAGVVLSARMLFPGAPDGPDAVLRGTESAAFAPRERFALRLLYSAVAETFEVVSVGPMTVTHTDRPPPTGPDINFGTCCYTTPPLPGAYRLVVKGRLLPSGQQFSYELRYEVRAGR